MSRGREKKSLFTGKYVLCALVLLGLGAGCRKLPLIGKKGPTTLREIPAAQLAYKYQPDTPPPPAAVAPENPISVPGIRLDFESRRRDELLQRTVPSPDGQRALAVYATAAEQNNEFRIDMYAADGKFLRNVTPPVLAVVFPEQVAWSPDGNRITFIARKSSARAEQESPIEVAPTPPTVESSPTLLSEGSATPTPATNNGPVFAPVPVFDSEQIYLCDRDGYNMKPLTNREGYIYFFAKWAPDGHALAALNCREAEWNTRETAARTPAGRPRLLAPDGQERALSDALAESAPAWAPDSSKVAVGFDTEIEIYDAATAAPTRARLTLRNQMWQSAIAFDQKIAAQQPNRPAVPNPNGPPASFQPFVRLVWYDPKFLYGQTAFVRLYSNSTVNNFPRWHLVTLSPQPSALQ
jgi:dipeptidyl aminopeptidase/acylaminoacyl peptidase